jgi:hypothetical protein
MPFLMYFIDNCLLYSFLSLAVYHSAGIIFYLHRPNPPTADVFTQGKVKPSPKCSILFPLYYCKDLALCYIILLILSRLKMIQMLLSILFPMLSNIIAFSLANLKPELDIFSWQLEWCFNLTLP